VTTNTIGPGSTKYLRRVAEFPAADIAPFSRSETRETDGGVRRSQSPRRHRCGGIFQHSAEAAAAAIAA